MALMRFQTVKIRIKTKLSQENDVFNRLLALNDSITESKIELSIKS